MPVSNFKYSPRPLGGVDEVGDEQQHDTTSRAARKGLHVAAASRGASAISAAASPPHAADDASSVQAAPIAAPLPRAAAAAASPHVAATAPTPHVTAIAASPPHAAACATTSPLRRHHAEAPADTPSHSGTKRTRDIEGQSDSVGVDGIDEDGFCAANFNGSLP